ncbi:hypothetical protein SDC9_196241 [bioreactor metagenome]|uniref:Uncharacterized protein n=1 Tax=bioreactor metagenome TaxID=1076179 RepID=A0A645IBB3_9ZZZZ
MGIIHIHIIKLIGINCIGTVNLDHKRYIKTYYPGGKKRYRTGYIKGACSRRLAPFCHENEHKKSPNLEDWAFIMDM